MAGKKYWKISRVKILNLSHSQVVDAFGLKNVAQFAY